MWQRSRLSGKVLIGEPHWEIGDQDIGNPVDKRFMHFGIAMSETPKGGKAAVL
jgi:hypothetical protein